MTATQNGKARHRAACRPTTVFTPLVQQAQRSSRATVAMAASGGLALTLIAVPALADQSDLQPVDVSTLTRDARRAMATNPTVTAPASATFSLDEQVVVAAAPQAAPVVAEPTPEATEEAEPASRDEERAALSETPQETAAETPAPAPEQTPEAEEPAVPEAPAPDTGGVGTPGAVAIAERYLGVPYVWGGSDPSGFDCSGLTSFVYGQLGFSLPRTSGAQTPGYQVSPDAALPGDLVNWGDHVGIYAGNGQVIHAPTFGRTVEYSSIWGAPTYWRVNG